MTAPGREQRALGWLAVPASIALVATGIIVGRTSVRPTAVEVREVAATPTVKDDRRLSALEQEVRRLRVTVAASSRPSREAPPDEPDPTASEREPAPEQAVDPAEAERATESARSEFFDGLSDRLEIEARDAAFATQTEPVISRLLQQHLGPEVRVGEVACGSSLCRANVIHPQSPRLAEDRLADFMLQRESLGKMSVQLDLREEGVTTLYFMRGDG